MIIWTDEEWNALTTQVWLMRKNNPGDSLVSIINRAQQQFPKERRRFVKTVQTVQKILTLLKAYDEKLAHESTEYHKVKHSTRSPLTIEEVAEAATDEEILLHFRKRVVGLLSLPDLLDIFDTEDLLSIFPLSRIVGYVTAELFEAVQSNGRTETVTYVQPPANGPPVMSPVAVKRQRLQKLCIVGLLPNQVNIVKSKVGRLADLYFYSTGKAESTDLPYTMDYYILMKKFIQHINQNSVQKIDKNKLVLIDGGLTKLMERIRVLTNG